jgi:hypothetical protein
MNRQRAAQLRISPLHIQQGLFLLLALLVTLVVGQQIMSWHYSQQPEAPRVTIQHPTQSHFSAVSSMQTESAALRMMDVDQAQPVNDMPRQERWVF